MKTIHTKGRMIGLLGGSFNPAHGGHVQLSLCALKTLKLDAVWWLVAPHNPLKDAADLAPYQKRFAQAQALVTHPRILISDAERSMKTRYSIDTIRQLKRRFPGTQFVWLMGADNLAQFHRWKKWQQIFAEVPVAVFDRAPYSHRPHRAKAALRNRRFLLKINRISHFWPKNALVWVPMPRNPLSSTAIRKNLEKTTI